MPRILAIVALVAALATPCAAQPRADPTWVGDFTVLSANVLLGAVSAGTAQKARGGSFRDGFTRGAAGGAGVYAGKRIATRHFAGAGFLGREVASVGASVIWNAGEGRPSFDRVALPLGPVRFYVTPRGHGPRVRARVDVAGAAMTGWAATRRELRWDVGRTLSAGAPVFRAPGRELVVGGESAYGLGAFGTVILGAPLLAPAPSERGFAHERVHVIQSDQSFLSLGRPAQEWLAGRVPGGHAVSRWIDVDLSVVAVLGLATIIDAHDERPWEMEAIALSGQ